MLNIVPCAQYLLMILKSRMEFLCFDLCPRIKECFFPLGLTTKSNLIHKSKKKFGIPDLSQYPSEFEDPGFELLSFH